MSKDIYEYGPFSVGDVVNMYRQDADTPEGLRWLLGEDVEIISPLGMHFDCDGDYLSYEVRHTAGYTFFAGANELRRKRPPTTGEGVIRAMFDTLPVERRQPATAWQAQYDTAQALMKMGVRVKPGAWPLEVA